MNPPLRSLRDRAACTLCALLGAVAVGAGAQTPTTPFAAPQPAGIQGGPDREAQEVTSLLRAKRIDAASTKVDAMLALNPKDAQARFLKGLVLADQGRTDEAIVAFRVLSEDYPELPEPYNNLASLYAATGQFDKARIALETAIQANPSYVTAYENLGDLYARMASQAWTKVLQLDKSNASTQAKLLSLRNAIGPAPQTPPAAPAPALQGAPAAKLPGR